jgi:hypothetical protein
VNLSSKDLRALKGRLLSYRRMAERAWSEETMHRTALPRDPHASRSQGQCGVTAQWLQPLLQDDLPTTYCIGELREPASVVHYHCWLEWGDPGSPDALVIDLTGDQAHGISDEVIVGRRHELENRGIVYRLVRKPSADELSRTSVVQRAERLVAAMRNAA